MQTYSYYSRTLLIEYLQKTIFFKIGKTLNKGYYSYFMLTNKNRLFISYDSTNRILKGFIKYENRNVKDFLIHSMVIRNNIHLENFVNYIDKGIEQKNLKKGFLNFDNSNNLDLSLDL